MIKALEFVGKLARNEEGAALIEYTVLLGILIVAVITVIGTVGGWVHNKWVALNASLT
jgi:pilus assembly protein Flp/PilA